MEIIKVFDTPHPRYGKFIAKSISYNEMKQSLVRLQDIKN